MPAAVAIGALAYLGAVRWDRDDTTDIAESHAPPSLPIWIGRLFPSLVCWLLLGALVLGFAAGTRTLPFYGLTALAGSFLLCQIAFVRGQDFSPALLLGQLLAICAVLRLSGVLLTPSYIGVDVFTHMPNYAAQIASTGSLATGLDGSKYIAAPLYHLVVVATALLADLPIRAALIASVGVGLIGILPAIYCAALYLPAVGRRWALFGTALFALMDYITHWTLHLIPSSLGLVFLLALLVCLVRLLASEAGRPTRRTIRPRSARRSQTAGGPGPTAATLACIVLLSIAVVLTDQVSTVILLAVLMAGVCVQLGLALRQVLSGGHADVQTKSRSQSGMAGTSPITDLTGVTAFVFGITIFVWAFTPHYGVSFTEAMLIILSDSAGIGSGAGGNGAGAGIGRSPTRCRSLVRKRPGVVTLTPMAPQGTHSPRRRCSTSRASGFSSS
jgi:hypothetical protein